MPYRAMNMVVAIIGALVLAGLLLAGVDVTRASRTGPGWRRKLLGTGLVLLASLGLVSCEKRPEGATVATRPSAGTTLGDTAQWKQLNTTWKDADDIASGKRGSYPFDEAGKKQILAALDRAGKDVNDLLAMGLLSEPEARLLGTELTTLTAGVQAKRPTEERMMSCYEPMGLGWEQQLSANRLAERLPLLEQLAAADTLKPEVVEKILAGVEADLASLSRLQSGPQSPEKDLAEAARVRDAVQAQVDKIRERLGDRGPWLEHRPEWKTIQAAWDFVGPLAESGQSTNAQRKEADEKLKAVETATGKLAHLGFISYSEAQLLNMEAAKLHEDLYRNPPVPAAGEERTLCYDMMAIQPARKSMQRLSQSLLFLQPLAKEERLNEPVLAKVVRSMETDLATLTDEKELAKLPATERAEADKVRPQVEKALADLKRRMEKPK